MAERGDSAGEITPLTDQGVAVVVIIPIRSSAAATYTDETSVDGRVTGGDKVCIDGQVEDVHSLDWFYKVTQFFPDAKGEIKSAEVAARFKNFPPGIQRAIWLGMGRVKIHIVDPRGYHHRLDKLLRRVSKDDGAPQRVAREAREGIPQAQHLTQMMNERIAESILLDSTAVRVQTLGRLLLNPFFGLEPPDELLPFLSHRTAQPVVSTQHFAQSKSRVRDVASWSAKSAAAFHSSFDVGMNPKNYGEFCRYGDKDVLRSKMAQQLLTVHGFDDGNRKHLALLDETQNAVFRELAANDCLEGLIVRRPGIIPLESKESIHIQAADIAAGMAKDIYETHGLLAVVEKFEYVTFNGVRISPTEAEEEMRKLATLGLAG